jgi:hypothetical protein
LAIALSWSFSIIPAKAHTQSTAFLNIHATGKEFFGQWHIALRDLEDCVGLDADDDGTITWEELRSRRAAVEAYAKSRLKLASEVGPLKLDVTNLLVDTHSDGATYAVLGFRSQGPRGPAKLSISYRALFDLDAKHRALLKLEFSDGTRTAVFSPENSVQSFDLSDSQRHRQPVLDFFREGVWHIWHGYDHILFLLAMLFPSVLRRVGRSWVPVTELKLALLNVLRVVTAFTIAHSITLGLAVFGVVHVPGRFIEAAIAASVAAAAVNNMFPFFSGREWMAAFGFGLLHGFGFANALADLGLHAGGIVLPLLGFNLGVEAGQLAIVGGFMPLAFVARELIFYPRVVLQAGSSVILAVAGMWLAERVFDFKCLPF